LDRPGARGNTGLPLRQLCTTGVDYIS